MSGMERYINLDGLEQRKKEVVETRVPPIVVKHDEVEVHGKGIVQKLIERYRN